MDIKIPDIFLIRKRKIKNKTSLKIITLTSTFSIFKETGKAEKREATPGINKVLKALDPTTLPRAISDFLLTNAVRATANSGRLVPTESKKRPISLSENPKNSPIPAAEETVIRAPKKRRRKPERIKTPVIKKE